MNFNMNFKLFHNEISDNNITAGTYDKLYM